MQQHIFIITFSFNAQLQQFRMSAQIDEEIEVTISNLPNQSKQKEIIDYLQTAGPIKAYKFYREDQKFSVIVFYFDLESAEICKKYLGQRYYKGRDLKIIINQKKTNQIQISNPNLLLSEEQIIVKQVSQLKFVEKKMLIGMLKKFKNQNEKLFFNFLTSMPKLLQALVQKPYG